MRPILTKLIVLVLAQSLQPCKAADTAEGISIDEDSARTARDLISATVEEDGPGVIASVFHHGNAMFTASAGLASLDVPRLIDDRTVFCVGSVSKQFTAFAAQLLIAEDRLSMSSDARDLLPYLRHHTEPITVEQLIHHTSGLKDVWWVLGLAGASEADDIDQTHFRFLFSRQSSLNFKSGTKLEYTNTGYTILADVVEAASGQAFADFVADRIFRPLGMTDSLVFDEIGTIVPNTARPYMRMTRSENGGESAGARPWQEVPLTYASYGTTNVRASARDLGKWLDNLLTPIPEHATAAAAMRKLGSLTDGREVNYASGLYKEIIAGQRAFAHGGHDQEFYASVAFFPESGHSIVVLANSEQPIRQLRNTIAELLVGEETGRNPAPSNPIAGNREKQAAVGAYLAEEGFAARIVDHEGQLYFYDVEGDIEPMTLLEGGYFYTGDWSGRLHGKLQEDGSDRILVTPLPTAAATHDHLRRSIRYTKLPEDPNGEPAFSVGSYYSYELDTLVSIEQLGDVPVMRTRRIPPHALVAIGAGRYVVSPYDTPYTVTFDMENSAAPGFSLSNVYYQDIRFVRVDIAAPPTNLTRH